VAASPLSLAADGSTERLQRLVERVLELVGVTQPPDRVRDAVIEALTVPGDPGALPPVGHSTDPDAPPAAPAPPWMCTLHRTLGVLGLKVSRLRTDVATAVASVGPQRPLLAVGRRGDELVLTVVADRRGRDVLLEVPGVEEPRWMSVDAVAQSMASQDASLEWLAIDSATPLELEVGQDPQGHGGHPTPQQRLWALIRAERHDLGAILVYALFLGLFTLTLPIAVQSLVSTVAFGTLLQPLVVLTALLVGALVFSGTMRAAQTYLVEILQRRIFVRVVADLAHRLPRVSRAALDRVDGPELVNRFFDTFTVQKTAAALLLDGVQIVLTILVGMLVLAFYHPLLLAFDVLLVLLVGVVVVVLGRRGSETAIRESYRKYDTAAWLEELARHDALFKLGGGLRYAELRAEALARDYLGRRQEHFRVVFQQTIATLSLQALANAAVLGIGGWLVIGRQLTLGQLVAAELIVTTVVASLAKIGKYLENYYDLVAAIDKLGHLTDLPLEREGGASCQMVGEGGRGAALVVDAVRGGYSGGNEVLSGVSFRVESGQRVALSGSTGSGKSLLVEMIAALRQPSSGQILVDGLDVRDLDLPAFREKVAVVRSEVISGTILDNVRLGRPNVDTTRVREALAKVGLLADVDAMPEGLRTELTSAGEPLSSSQKLRLAIARAIAGDPVLLVLDDAIDGLDPRVREPMLDALFAPSNPWTLVVTSNDPRVHARCEAVWRLDDGRVYGPHEAAREGRG
jgi:ABC-type bacteriocin/lantibiotic exporter with double-glycine peptidase domain